MKPVNIQKIEFTFENGTKISILGEEARQKAKDWLGGDNDLSKIGWNVDNEVPVKSPSLLKKVLKLFK